MRYKSSLAIRSTKPAASSSVAVVVGDSEAVQDILTGGRNKQPEEVKEEEEKVGTVSAAALTPAAIAAAGLLDGSDDSDVDDGVDVVGRGGKWQVQASAGRVFGSNHHTTSKLPANDNADSDDEDMVVVKG